MTNERHRLAYVVVNIIANELRVLGNAPGLGGGWGCSVTGEIDRVGTTRVGEDAGQGPHILNTVSPSV